RVGDRLAFECRPAVLGCGNCSDQPDRDLPARAKSARKLAGVDCGGCSRNWRLLVPRTLCDGGSLRSLSRIGVSGVVDMATELSTVARAGHGLVLGKFLPPHRGHQFLIDFARRYAERLTVLVCTLERDPIPGHLRFEWVRRMCPDESIRVVHVTDDVPQTPEEHPDFWSIWRDLIQRYAPGRLDYFFASEDYGHRTAE